MSIQEQTYLKNLNLHKRDNYITFDEGPHIYTISLFDNSGNKYERSDFTSVTTWCHSHFNHFDADKIIKKMMNSSKWSQNKYYGMKVEEIKALWDKNRDEAAQSGTKMHWDIECFYNLNFNENASVEYQYFMNFEKDRLNDEIGFGKDWKPYRTEWMIYDEELELCGSVDMTYIDSDNNIHIYDWKRCKEIKKANQWQSALTDCINHLPDTNYWHYSLQLNIYKTILERKYGFKDKVKSLYLVVLHPENKNKNYMRIKVPILKDEMNDLVEYRIRQIKK